MLKKRIAVGILLVVVAGLLSVTLLPSGAVSGSAAPSAPTCNGTQADRTKADSCIIQGGEMFFAVPGQPQTPYPPGTSAQSILTITGGKTGKILLNIENIGKAQHEYMSALFTASTEVKAELFDSSGNRVGYVESSNLYELNLSPGWKATLTIELAHYIVESLTADSTLTIPFEISCHLPGHYETGMRALITIAP